MATTTLTTDTFERTGPGAGSTKSPAAAANRK